MLGSLIWVVWVWTLWVGDRVDPRFYVHPNGHVSMGGKDGPEVDPADISRRFETMRMWPGRIVIESDPELPMKKLEPLISTLQGLDFHCYQLRSNGIALNCSGPYEGWGCCAVKTGNPNPEIIDLRAHGALEPSPALSNRGDLPWGDVSVAADGDISCGELLSETKASQRKGVSMEIHVENLHLSRSEFEDVERPDYPNPYLPKSIWSRVSDYLRRRF